MTATERVIVLSPRIDGADGISEVGRQIVAALRHDAVHPGVALWVLDGTAAGANVENAWLANGQRWRFATRGLREWTDVGSHVTVVSLHLHLGPVALPLVTRGARLVQMIYGIEAWRAAGGLMGRAVDRTAAFIVISADSRARFLAAHPRVDPRRAVVCHPGVPPLAPPDLEPMGGGPFALIVGRMAAAERYKGHDELIDAWTDVRRQVPLARLVIVGDGDDRGRLEGRVRAAGLGEAVVFTGRVSPTRLATLYRDATCFVMPSRGEGFGLVYLEAMAHGKPCLGGPGAAEEIIDHGRTGLIVSPSDREALVAGIARLFRPESRAMGDAGRARVAEHFQSCHFEARFLDAIQSPVTTSSQALS